MGVGRNGWHEMTIWIQKETLTKEELENWNEEGLGWVGVGVSEQGKKNIMVLDLGMI